MTSKLTIEAIEILDAISRKGSFAAAAKSLHKVPSALTYQMGKLEKDIDVDLFNRDGYRTTLTEAGKVLLKEGRQLLASVQSVESRVKQAATGIETELTIAINDIIEVEKVYSTLDAFYQAGFETQITLINEAFGGAWDAISYKRADIAIGAPGDAPINGLFASTHIGDIEFVFAVAPNHPLAAEPEPLSREIITKHRAVVTSDSSRNLPPRSSGIFNDINTLNVPDIKTKVSAQLAGLGGGNLPSHIVDRYVASSQLIKKTVSLPKIISPIHIVSAAPSVGNMGKAHTWLFKALSKLTLEELMID